MRLVYLFLFVIFILEAKGQTIETVFPLLWKLEIGQTSYRTNMGFYNAQDALVIGSNGKDRGELGDSGDGVYQINPNTGEIDFHYLPLHKGDGDVNGVAIDGEKLFFGDDHGYFSCFMSNDLVWKYDIFNASSTKEHADIETVPVLEDLNADGVKDVIFVAENNGIYALDGKTGSELWKHIAIHQKYLSYGLNSPALIDCNGDGVKDVVWGTRTSETYKDENDAWPTYGDWLIALDGTNGEEIWRFPSYSAIHSSPVIWEYKRELYIVMAEVYSTLNVLDKKGDKVASWAGSIPDHGGISGLFSTPTINKKNRLIIGTSWWGVRDGIWSLDLAALLEYESLDSINSSFIQAGKVSASAVIGDVVKSNKGNEMIIPSEDGKLYIFNDAGELIKELRLPSGSEATPFLYDVDGDKKSELLIACYDGDLYCYETSGKNKKKKLEHSAFREKNQ